LYGSDDCRAKIEPPSCQQYKLGEFLAISKLSWDEKIDKDDNDEHWADAGALSSGMGRPSDVNKNDDGDCEEDTQVCEKGIGKGKG
jgi:hypothetical protein